MDCCPLGDQDSLDWESSHEPKGALMDEDEDQVCDIVIEEPGKDDLSKRDGSSGKPSFPSWSAWFKSSSQNELPETLVNKERDSSK
mmetsp:Transcript_63660/g.110954  ORF Transcript_63660/g.110954 Transcript_63660/m.110954 type:complete len:86 (+) Transcript_63660:421-678(+)